MTTKKKHEGVLILWDACGRKRFYLTKNSSLLNPLQALIYLFMYFLFSNTSGV